MILIDNVVYLKKRFPQTWDKIKKKENNPHSILNVQMPNSKTDQSTLTIEAGGRTMYIHSKYDPTEEARLFIDHFIDLDKYEHVFFYGIGLGYHIDAFVQKYPNKVFTIYEPIPEIFAKYLTRKSLKDFNTKQLKSIFVEDGDFDSAQYISDFVNNLNEEILLIQLPSYERTFDTKCKYFNEKFVELLSQRRLMFQVYSNFEKRWTFNSMVNLETTLKTPNIIVQKKEYFENKPVIIVAAGPSLQEEIENLKYIKEHGLAYIFSVGTSINALLANGLEPDAACTYDPSFLNQKVFEKLKEEGKEIPLIYGSTVGFEVLKGYKGPMFHMLTNQDDIAKYYLREMEGKVNEVIQDAASIAIIVLQLLQKLNCNPVILVGQNLAFKNNQLYSTGANVIRNHSEVMTEDKVEAVSVESVNGDLVETNKDLNAMRFQLESFISSNPITKVINTTKGGAKIAHTSYVPLNELIAQSLKSRVVERNWLAAENSCYDLEYARNQATEMKSEHLLLLQYFDQITKIFNELNRGAERRNVKVLMKIFPKFDKLFTKILNNVFFETFIRPMNKVNFDILMLNIEKMRFENDNVAKAKMIIQEFGKFIYSCHSDTLTIEPLFQVIQEEVITMNQKEE
ncbi:MAG: 6-hydroxymethylpterin diphosphokinase MptE-like protein [Paenibacillaceae bacterium]